MRLLIFGANGMLGHKLVQRLGSRFDVWGTVRGGFASVERFGIFDQDRTIEGVDVQSTESIERALDRVRPDVVINAIGVIKQLPTANDVITTLTINSIFPQRLAQYAAKFGYRLIGISTDCVFDGKKGNYSEADNTNAYDTYGKSKALGEVTGENCLTLRTSIIGRELGTRHSLVEWFLSNRGGRVKGYTQAIYSGFPTLVFADIIANLIADHKELSGLYHVASAPINKFDLLNLVNRSYDAGIEIEPSDELVIDRSLDAAKFAAATGFVPLAWEEMIDKMAEDPMPYGTFNR